MDLVALAREARVSRDFTELRVYADWLEQQGDPARGALLHLQCELAELSVHERRAHEARWEILALVAEHGKRWRAELPAIEGIEWTDFELGCIAGARVRDVDHLMRHAEALASEGLVDRIELVSDAGAIDPDIQLDFIETVRVRLSSRPTRALGLGTKLELVGDADTAIDEISRRRPLQRLAIAGASEIGGALVDELAGAKWAARMTELEIPTLHEGDNSGYAADPTLGVEGATRLVALKALERVNIDRQRVTTAGLKKLAAGLPHLRSLSARECGSGKLTLGKGASLVELDLSRNALKNDGVRALVNEPRLTELHRLVLDTCELESLALSAIIAAPMWNTLRVLDLSRNPLGAGGARTLADAPAPEQLHTLAIADTDLDDKGHAAIAKVPWLGQLLALDLSGNMLGRGSVALRAIAPDRLRRLALSSTGMERADAAALARFWPHLVELELANNPFGDAALERFAVMRDATRLQSLDLRNCALTDDGLDMLGNARCPQLRTLLLGHNIFGRGLVPFLATAVCARLEVLDLSHCALPATAIDALAKAPPPRLRELDLRGHALSVNALLALARAPALRAVKLHLQGAPWTYPDAARD